MHHLCDERTKKRTAGNESGIVLLMVILVIAGVFTIALPLALLSRSAEQRNERLLDKMTAKRYAELALAHTKNRLRLGIYENEFYYIYPTPTAEPTPTPDLIAERAPYDTPFFDGEAELYFDRKRDWDIRFGTGAMQTGDGVIVGIHVEDEQGKINLNSVTPALLRGLYMAVTSMDPAAMSASERTELKEYFEKVIDPIANYRISDPDVYRMFSSIDEIGQMVFDDGDETLRLSTSEQELLKKHLTTYSWRLFKDGFSNSTSSGFIQQEMLERGYIVALAGYNSTYRDYWSPFRVIITDKNDAVLRKYTVYPVVVSDFYVLPLPDDLPETAWRYYYTQEHQHMVNLNTCSREVLLAYIMAGIDIDNPEWTLEEAVEAVKYIKPTGKLDRYDKGEKYRFYFSSDTDTSYFLSVSRQYSVAGRYVTATVTDDYIEVAEDIGIALSEYTFPLSITRTHSSNPTYQYAGLANESLKNRLSVVFGSSQNFVGNRKNNIICRSYDIYTIVITASLNSIFGLETGTYTIKEVVELGEMRSSDETYTAVDTYGDFVPAQTLISTGTAGRKTQMMPDGYWYSGILDDRVNSIGVSETYPSTNGMYYCLYTSPNYNSSSGIFYFSRNSFRITSGTIASSIGSEFLAFRLVYTDFSPSNMIEPIVTETSSISLQKVMTNEIPTIRELGKESDLYAGSGNIGFTAWIKAKGWDPSSTTGKHSIYTVRPTETSTVGEIELAVIDGALTLTVTDDAGGWGKLSYPLTSAIFPKDSWMFVGFQAGGNKRGQMAIFVDNMLVEAEYSASSEKGYCHKSATSFSRTKPTLTMAVDAAAVSLQVSSASDFPTSGWLRIEDELIYYGSRTDIAFNSLRRGAAGTDAATHEAGKIVVSAFAISGEPAPDELPASGESVTLISYYQIGSYDPVPYYARSLDRTETFTLDMDAKYDSTANMWVFAPPLDVTYSQPSQLKVSATDLLFAFFGNSGTLLTGDYNTGRLNLFILAADSSAPAFVGSIACAAVLRPFENTFRIPISIEESDSTASSTLFPGSAECGLVAVGEEIIGYRRADGQLVLTRGMLGSKTQSHIAGDWALPVAMHKVSVLNNDLTPTLSSYTSDTSGFSGTYRINDEVLHYQSMARKIESEPIQYEYNVSMLRGYLGSTPSAHSVGDLMISFHTFNQFTYDATGTTSLRNTHLDFMRTKAGSRIVAMARENLIDSDYIRTHMWISPHSAGSLMNDFKLGSTTPGMLYFDSKSGRVEVFDEPIISDSITIRLAFEYKEGAWKPNDPTAHEWKVGPVLDKIVLFCEDPDTILYHEEGH